MWDKSYILFADALAFAYLDDVVIHIETRDAETAAHLHDSIRSSIFAPLAETSSTSKSFRARSICSTFGNTLSCARLF